jgi:excisionase family DNA binding protein
MKLLTTRQVAERLGVSIGRIHQLINEGRLPAEKLGRDYVIQEEDLTLVESRKVGRPPKAKANSKVGRKR